MKSEIESFNGMEVNTAKYYDEQGNLTKEYQYTSVEWLDRIVKVVKEKLNVDLWSENKVTLYRGKRQDRYVVTILHNNGDDLEQIISGAKKYSSF